MQQPDLSTARLCRFGRCRRKACTERCRVWMTIKEEDAGGGGGNDTLACVAMGRGLVG